MNTFAERLRSARIMTKLSMDGLVERIDGAVTKQSISKYERGLSLPDSDLLIKLAQALSVPVDYFFRERFISLETINFRKKAGLAEKELGSIQEQVKDSLERYIELETLLGINPNFVNPLKEQIISSLEDVEQAAERVREFWRAGASSPITSVISLLEENEVKIIELKVGEGFEGLSGLANGNPVIILRSDSSNDRKRFTALHELAHLILRVEGALEKKEKERLCHSLAGALLLPRQAVLKELSAPSRSNISLFELVKIKEHYGISIQAVMARAKAVGIISEYVYKQFNILINRYQWRVQEPGVYPVHEKSVRFKQLLHHAMAEEMISISKAAVLSGSSIEELQREMVQAE